MRTMRLSKISGCVWIRRRTLVPPMLLSRGGSSNSSRCPREVYVIERSDRPRVQFYYGWSCCSSIVSPSFDVGTVLRAQANLTRRDERRPRPGLSSRPKDPHHWALEPKFEMGLEGKLSIP